MATSGGDGAATAATVGASRDGIAGAGRVPASAGLAGTRGAQPLTRPARAPSLQAMSDLVMVVEDEKEIRDLLRYNLERAGFRVATVADGEQAIEQIFGSRPDALVLDLMLPGRSGLEVLREV